jgi:hypothetical protein
MLLLTPPREAGTGTLTWVMTPLVLTDRRNPGCVIVAHSSATARVRARMCTRQLDRELAQGISPDSSAVLSVRAHDLIGVRTRSMLAQSIRRLLDEAAHPLRPLHFTVPICRSKVWRCRHTLVEVADRLVGGEPLDARGVAQLRLLLSDGAGPLYDHPGANDLAPALQRVIAALEVRAA